MKEVFTTTVDYKKATSDEFRREIERCQDWTSDFYDDFPIVDSCIDIPQWDSVLNSNLKISLLEKELAKSPKPERERKLLAIKCRHAHRICLLLAGALQSD